MRAGSLRLLLCIFYFSLRCLRLHEAHTLLVLCISLLGTVQTRIVFELIANKVVKDLDLVTLLNARKPDGRPTGGAVNVS